MRRISRRRFLTGLGGTLAMPHLVRAAGPAGSITVVGFFGIFEDVYTKAVIQPFMQRFPDIAVTFRPVLGSAEATAMLRTQRGRPTADVVIMDLGVAEQNNRDGNFAALDPALVPNLSQLPDWGRPAGNMGAALTQDVLALLVNTKQARKRPEHWADLADPVFAGRLAMPIGDVRGTVLLALLCRQAGVDYKQSVDAGIAAMKRFAPNVQTYEPQPDVYTALRSGLMDVGVGWNARGQLNQDQSNGEFAVVLPVEGTAPQVNTINLVAKTPNAAAAQTFINYALGAEAQRAFAQGLFYGPTNQTVQLPPALDLRIFGTPEARSRQMALDWDWFSHNNNALIQRIRREVIAG